MHIGMNSNFRSVLVHDSDFIRLVIEQGDWGEINRDITEVTY